MNHSIFPVVGKSARRIGRRLTTVVAALTLSAMPVIGATYDEWQLSDARKPIGSGSQEDPYIIATGANLFWLSSNIGIEEISDKWFVQTADIDLEGKNWLPIGGRLSGSFTGHYDGRGHVIRGLVLDWSKAGRILNPTNLTIEPNENSTYVSYYGLFGHLSGTVVNLVIDGAEIVQGDMTAEAESTSDLGMGVLAGAVGNEEVEISNIIVRNSRIADNGDDTNRFLAPAYLVGGLISDIHGDMIDNYTGSDRRYNIKNVYVDVDFDLSHTELSSSRSWGNKGHQYYVGGIIGRLRSINIANQMPTNTLFSGTINAPMSMVGPVFGGSRFNNAAVGNYDGLKNTFAGDFTDKQKGTSTHNQFNSNYYTDFKVYNYSNATTPVLETVTDNNSTSHTYANASLVTRTFKPQQSVTINDSNRPTMETMAMFQGVNRGRYVSVPDSVANVFTHAGYTWDFTGDRREMIPDQPVTINLNFVNPFLINAEYITDRPAESEYILRWFTFSEHGEAEEISASRVEASGRNSSLQGFSDNSDIFVVLYDGNNAIESKYLNINSIAEATLEQTGNTYTVKVNGSTTLPTGYSIEKWAIADMDGDDYDISHLSGSTAADLQSITIDPSITPRVLYAKINRDGLSPIYAWQPVPASTISITYENEEYKAMIDGTTDLTGYPFTYRWEVRYDGGDLESFPNVTSVKPEDDFTNPGYNALINLVITDHYTSASATDRYMADDRTLNIIRNGDTLVAKIDNGVPAGTWEWHGISGDILDGATGYILESTTNELEIDRTNDKYNNYYLVWTSTDGKSRLVGYYSTHNIIYVYNRSVTQQHSGYDRILATYPDGNDGNSGRTPYTAVKTMDRAYALLDGQAAAEDNVIVLMGFVKEDKFFEMSANYIPLAKYNKDATLTGYYGEIAETGSIFIGHPADNDNAIRGINGRTIFENVIISGDGDAVVTFYCNLHDLVIGPNVKVTGYQDIPINKNGLGEYVAPHFTIVSGFHNYNNNSLVYPASNEREGRITIKIQSGNFGRIIAGSRNNYSGSTYNHVSNNIFGHPDWPHRVDVEIAIKHIKDMRDYAPDKAIPYKFDIGLLVGGVTDGSIYTDSRLYMGSGSVGRFISGNISYGRKVGDGFPADGFFGSTVFTMEDGAINELIGGTLGRHDKGDLGTATCEAFFYGRSIINLNGGTILTNIYGAGAGGVVGVGDDTYHTMDEHIPYLTGNTANGNAEVLYGPYGTAKGRLPKIKLKDEDEDLDIDPEDNTRTILDLNKSYTAVNINGGVVKGNVYGGGYGYSINVKVDKALKQAGNVYGNTHVSINGGLVEGSVFGGGAGSNMYFIDPKATNPDDFKSLANVYGNTNVEVSGGIIEGNVYAGSQGIKNLPLMATVVGDTHLLVKQERENDNTWRIPIINGEIYGGSQRGRIVGDTHVDITGGAIGSNIYGGSEGTLASDTTMAVIKGNTHLNISGGMFFTDEYCQKISDKHRINPANRMFNIYGGGNINCVIDGSTYVNVTRSLFASHKNILEKEKYPAFSDCMSDDTYRKFSIYGGGQGNLTDITKDTHLDINIEGGASVPSVRPIDVASNQQFVMIAGGGYSGNVYGNTNVTLRGNVFGRRAFGGSMYGRVEGESHLNLISGSLHQVYGGGLLGDVMKGSYITVGTKATPGKEEEAAATNRNIYIYDNVYGGNDVGGIVGYEKSANEWTTGQNNDHFMVRMYDSETDEVSYTPYTYHIGSDIYGCNLRIYGGNIKGSVYGAGNGNHTGYYVPNGAPSEHHDAGFLRMKYTDGPAYLYRLDKTDPKWTTRNLIKSESDKINWGTYEYRPRTNRVRVHIAGNSETDRVRIGESVFGGGHACTVGRFNPQKDVLTDPSRFIGGGSVKVNFGSHVTVTNGVYMGSSGNIIGKQTVTDGDPHSQAVQEADFDYHYYDPVNKRYLLGYPNSVEGRNRFHAYLKLIDIDAPTQLTFYNDPESTPEEMLPTVDINDIPESALEASDIRWGSFYSGGARGSMTYNAPGDGLCYHYILPEGLTVETHVVGGSDDAMVRFYEYSPDYTSYDTSKPIFTYHGGVVYDINDGVNGFGGGVIQWHSAPAGTPESELIVGNMTPRDERVVVKLDVRCQFEPPMSSYTDENNETHPMRYGGLVYGGCYNSGITNGSVEVHCSGNLLGPYYESDDFEDYLAWSTLRHNIGRVYGGGFGVNANIRGRTHVLLDGDFRGFNVFGGGMMGDVSMGTNITVKGLAKVYNAIYGGGMFGSTGLDPITGIVHTKNIGTNLYLRSGGIDRVYGGAFMGDVYGGTHISISDEDLPANSPRLLIGSVFGGNDVTGVVYPDEATDLCTDITMSEQPRPDKESHTLSHKADDGSDNYYSGFPMVGSIYGAGNGNMNDYIPGVTIDRDAHEYNGGIIHIANGNKADIDIWNLGELRYKLPDVETTRINITGGTAINVYGGGSMCTVSRRNLVEINYTDTVARAAFNTAQSDRMTWGVLRLFEVMQQEELTQIVGDNTRFSHQIYRVFGGNNLMDMDIQPGWNLQRGTLFSVYSGGNFGRMTYPDGLTLTVDSPDLRIDAVYGGGRVGDIDASDATGTRIEFGPDKYGATLNVRNGFIGDVYGGNNVAGVVYNGTNVNIEGAVSGNVYGSGNGNYIYYYDFDGSHATFGEETRITEAFNKNFGGRYFILPPKEAYPGKYYNDSPQEKIIAINSYRPNVEKAYVNVSGTEESPVFVLGNVFCGGNSSTVISNPAQATEQGNIKLRIGSHVAIGGVFLGSNGEGLANGYNIANLFNLNEISNLKEANDFNQHAGFQGENRTKLSFRDQGALDDVIYPNILSLYMRAAEVTALPDKIILPEDATESYVGNFTVGGNYGSMMSDKTINIDLPPTLTIIGRVVGGCYNSRVEYNGAVSEGGMVKPLKPGVTDRLNMKIRSRFRPLRIEYNEDTHQVKLVNNRTDSLGNFVADADVQPGAKYYYQEGVGNIFGGCFNSGKTVGNINIDVYSDVLGRYVSAPAGQSGEPVLAQSADPETVMNNVAIRRTVFSVIGAGYGPQSTVVGDTHIRLLPNPTDEDVTTHPAVCTIFGGSHDGLHVGTSTTEVRDGMVLSSLYASSRAAFKYGSSEVIIGYPGYYRCEVDGIYTLNRADQYSYVARATAAANGKYTHAMTGRTYESLNADTTQVIKQTVRYRRGDIVAANVVDEIVGFKTKENGAVTPISDITAYFTYHRESPTDFSSKWNNIDINIGDNSRMNDVDAKFLGGGSIYGGGHALNNVGKTLSGIPTQLAYTDDNNPDGIAGSSAVGFGGNSTILVADNPANNAVNDQGKILYSSVGPDGEAIRDHVSIGTGHYVPVKVDPTSGDKIGLYARRVDAGGNVSFEHQSSGTPEAGTTYYRMETEGGIYGDGRRTFVQNFRAVDVEGYGYADYNPQSAKLLSTFHRIDLLSLTDCCLQLQGAPDYATNSVDATLYSVARVGELRLNSSLRGALTPSVDDESLPGNLRLDTPRSRNYMGFFHSVHYIGAIASNTPMDPDADDPLKEGEFRGPDGQPVSGKSYRQAKNELIRTYQSLADTDDDDTKRAKNLAFKKRNMATAPNLIGINNGYTLKVQNAFTTKATGLTDGILRLEAEDNIYYGPILGVVEVKLLTLAQDEGGGYIYAFNSHSDNVDETDTTKDPGFLEATGNFVYPAAIDENTDNYIVDDCYPIGYYSNHNNAESEEAHYWYVTGHNYYFNATLTGYTFNGPAIDFRLNNADNLILLSGIETSKADKIQIESIAWEDHVDPNYECAFTHDLDPGEGDSRSNYQFFMTIDKTTSNNFSLTNPGNSFVAQIPNGNGPGAYGTNEDGTFKVVNNYSDYSQGDYNSPTLGIRLHDTDSNNQIPTFYHNHLEDPDVVVIKIKSEDLEGKENTYTIRLNIVYLQGPYIEGKINVENCALPGEYIYANTEDVVVEMDESLTVTAKRWYLYPRNKDDLSQEVFSWDSTPAGRVDVTQYLMDDLAGDVNRLQLPARYYQNGWKVGYSIVVNGQDFPLADPAPGDQSNMLTVHNYHRMSTLSRTVKDITRRHSSTYPFEAELGTVDKSYYGFDIDLDLVGGALVYIEDDQDFALFTKYVNYCNEVRRDASGNVEYHQEDGRDVATLVAQVLPGYNANGYISGIANQRTVEGYLDTQDVPYRNVKDPTGAQNIRFVLKADVKITDECLPITEFRGRLNGLGHTIYFDESFRGLNFIDTNYGEIHDVGFTSSGGEDSGGETTSIVKNNKGRIENCYYFNYPSGHPEAETDYSGTTYSTLVGENLTETTQNPDLTYVGSTSNCYQNTNKQNADNIEGVRYLNTRRFHNGMVAFNLNQEYLKARYNSHDNDELVRSTILSSATDPNLLPMDYLYSYYSDGEYRYADTYSPEHPEGLRLPDNFGTPNYQNYMGSGQSMHISDYNAHKDERRWFKVEGAEIVQRDVHGNAMYDENGRPVTSDEGYFPIYLYDANHELADHSDFILFGQRLTNDEDRDYYPHRVSSANRVYRSGGYYGSDADFGFYFNRDVVAMNPSLTAIDFTGYNDLPDPTNPGHTQYAVGWRFHMLGSTHYTDGVYYEHHEDSSHDELLNLSSEDHLKQLIYFPPAVDLPGGDRSSYLSNLKSFDVVSNADINHHDAITKNLLVYTPGVGTSLDEISEEDDTRLFKQLHYTRMQQWGDVAGETPQNRIIGHQLLRNMHAGNTDPHFHVANRLFHLVDEQNFNAPIEFYITYEDESATSGRAWMLRKPQHYSSMIESDDPEVFTISKDAWESIALPFTCNRIWAVNSEDYVEKYSRGQITHFYGSDEVTGMAHHDYWLRGLVDTHADTREGDDVVASAQFARPGQSTSEETLFEVRDDQGNDQQRRGDYEYLNNWFYETYKDLAYNEHHNDYADPIMFEQYCYLTKNAPYIVAFPGPDYYEFDLSGEFFNLMHSTTGCKNQEILYEFSLDEIDPNNNFDMSDRNVRIPVTDYYESVRNTRVVGDDGTVTTHRATFMLIDKDHIDDNMYVLNTATVKADVAGETVTLPPGSAFINCKDFGITEILPFRTYITVDFATPNPGRRFVRIGSATGDTNRPNDDEVEEPQEPQSPEEEMTTEFNVWVEGEALMISTSSDLQLDIVNMMGRTVRRINAYAGVNRYTGLSKGFYIVGNKKVYIP